MSLPSVFSEIPSSYAILTLLLTTLAIVVVKSRIYRLEHVPGPFFSRYTDAYRAYMAWKYSGQDVNLYMKLHSQYGDVVRIGPRSISVLDPAAIPSIYGVKARFNKGPNVSAFNVPGVPRSVLGILDEHEHSRFRRPIQNAYSLTNLKGYEPYVDEIINMLVAVLDRYVEDKKQINLSLWVYYWSYEVIGKVTFGSPTGYLEKGADFNGLIHRQKQFLDYVNITFDFIKFAKERVDERIAKYDSSSTGRPDLLSHFIEARKPYPDVVTDNQVFVYALTNVIAGSLSTSHVLDEIVKYLTTHSDAQTRINDEVRLAANDDNFPISFDQARKVPYLEAVIFEGFRIHSVANLSSEREVGSNGLQLPSGVYLPPGTYVGVNPAAMNRRPDVFGAHPDVFDPLRWLRQQEETQEDFIERRLRMDRATLTFGQGSRSCLGKNIVQLELFKLIATLCTRYAVNLAPNYDKYEKLTFLQFYGVGKSELFEVYTTVGIREKA